MAQSHTLIRTLGRAEGGQTVLRVWLFTLAALVFLMVSVGGATRLTGSGLSITEWQPIIGILPPLSDAAWQEAFAKYQQIPQYQHVNRGMSLDAFKVIYWWEWTHRFLGRLIGLVFFVPFAVFLATRQIPRDLVGRLAGIFLLGGLQGVVGWYMVRSGLADRVDVSQYRLALHLTLALVIFAALLSVGLSLGAAPVRLPSTAATRRRAAIILTMLFLQVVLGAFVAGLKAGAGYNTWPLMDGRIVPSGLGAMDPWYLNLFENALTVQFNHRAMAYVLMALAAWHAAALFRSEAERPFRTSAIALLAGLLAQAALGVWTLLAQVPLGLGLAHQAGAVAVVGLAVWHLHTMRQA